MDQCQYLRNCAPTLSLVVAFVVPLLYMFFAYGKIAVSLWNRSKNGTIHKAVAKAKMKSTRLVVAAVPVFVVCWAPTLELQLLEAYCIVENLSSKYLFIVYFWCMILQISSSSIHKPCDLRIPVPWIQERSSQTLLLLLFKQLSFWSRGACHLIWTNQSSK